MIDPPPSVMEFNDLDKVMGEEAVVMVMEGGRGVGGLWPLLLTTTTTRLLPLSRSKGGAPIVVHGSCSIVNSFSITLHSTP